MSEILIQKLIKSNYSVVLYVAGVGSTALQTFTLYPGSSAFALESANFYGEGSLKQLLGRPIEKFVERIVAEEMALTALLKAHLILRTQEEPDSTKFLYTVGVGVTGAIRSTECRHGNHHAYISFHFGSRKYSYHLNLEKGVRSRVEEDAFISAKIIELLVLHCSQSPGKLNSQFLDEKCINPPPRNLQIENGSLSLLQSEEDIEIFDLLINQPDRLHSILVCGKNYQLNPVVEKAVVLSGSFNPPHQGHVELCHCAALKLQTHDVYFELSIVNADKGSIGCEETWRRINQLRQKNIKVIVSNKPLFKDKNVFLKNGAFAIGADTYKRLIDVKYYNNQISERDISFIKFLQNNNKIIVAPRYNEATQKMEALLDFEIPPLIAKNVIEMNGFRNDESSTKIRKKDNIRAQSTPH